MARRTRTNTGRNHCRYYRVGGLTLRIQAAAPILDETFHAKLKQFEVARPSRDVIRIRHHFGLPRVRKADLGKVVYRKPPWTIYEKANTWTYVSSIRSRGVRRTNQISIFSRDYTCGDVYHRSKDIFDRRSIPSLALLPTDQIILSQLLAYRKGCILHASGIALGGKGFLFVGHSGAGKSTVMKMLKGRGTILCDDRMILRRRSKGFVIYGNWSHGELPDIAARAAPLRAICFLRKAGGNRLILLKDKREIVRGLLSCLIKSFMSAEWWQKTLRLVGQIAQTVPCYRMEFDKSGRIAGLLERL